MRFHANRNKKKAEVAILKSDKTNFKTETAPKDKDHSIMINR